jgi:hypothetical protein
VTATDLQTLEDAEYERALADIPEELRFDAIEDRPSPDETPENERQPFAIGSRLLWARKPQDYTLTMLGAARSGRADGPDRAYAIMVFCHDAFDTATRDVIRTLKNEQLLKVITGLCTKWDQDTTKWGEAQPANRQERRAAARPRRR